MPDPLNPQPPQAPTTRPIPEEAAEETSRLDQTLEQIGRYRREILFVLGLVLAALVVYAVADSMQKTAEAEASAALAEARMTTEPGARADALLAVADAHAGTETAVVARLEAVLGRAATGAAPETVVETADAFLAEHGDHAFAGQVRLIRARALVAGGRLEEAADALETALAGTTPYLEAEMRMLRAEVLDRLGRDEEAREAYLRVSRTPAGEAAAPTLVRSAGLALVLLEDEGASALAPLASDATKETDATEAAPPADPGGPAGAPDEPETDASGADDAETAETEPAETDGTDAAPAE
jgi:tetratricopeptide (TPR) repeat protein